MKVRPCAVAGSFYPAESSHLRQLLEKFFRAEAIESGKGADGIVAPHAGYIYSGAVAASAFSAIPQGFSGTFVVIGPSHRGYMTCTSEIPWETPLGTVSNDTDFVRELNIEADEASHRNEHSLEVQMPFIRLRFPDAKIAPIMMGHQDIASSRIVAQRIVEAAKKTKREIRIVASSDFSHYVPEQKAKSDDVYAIEPLTHLDTTEFYRRIMEKQVTACGYGPIAAMVQACQSSGAKEAKIIRYATSGDVTGDRHEVVGYAAIAVM